MHMTKMTLIIGYSCDAIEKRSDRANSCDLHSMHESRTVAWMSNACSAVTEKFNKLPNVSNSTVSLVCTGPVDFTMWQ